MKIRNKFLLLAALAGLCLLVSVSALAADFPAKPITIINSATAGSPTDVLARQIAQYAEKFLKQPMVVVNKPGGGGGGATFAALLAEPADGYTVASITSSQITAIQSELKKDFAFEDFDFICGTQLDCYTIAVLEEGPFKTLKDVTEFGKREGMLMFGGQGTGTSHHLMVLRFAQLAGIKLTWFPYPGGADSVINLLNGRVHVIATSIATVRQYVEAKKIRIIAVSGAQRLLEFPDVPTFKESGYDIVITSYRGFIGKKGMSADVKAKLSESIKKAMEEPEFVDFTKKTNQVTEYMDSAEFLEYAKKDFAQMAEFTELMK